MYGGRVRKLRRDMNALLDTERALLSVITPDAVQCGIIKARILAVGKRIEAKKRRKQKERVSNIAALHGTGSREQ